MSVKGVFHDMSLRIYKQMLAKHDWHYSSSDSKVIYDKGLASERELRRIADDKITYREAYDAEFNKRFPKKKTSFVINRTKKTYTRKAVTTPQKPNAWDGITVVGKKNSTKLSGGMLTDDLLKDIVPVSTLRENKNGIDPILLNSLSRQRK